MQTVSFKVVIQVEALLDGLDSYSQFHIVQAPNRTLTTSIFSLTDCDTTTGVDAGLGLEVPPMRGKAYLGIQATYHYVSFSDENREFIQLGFPLLPASRLILGNFQFRLNEYL